MCVRRVGASTRLKEPSALSEWWGLVRREKPRRCAVEARVGVAASTVGLQSPARSAQALV